MPLTPPPDQDVVVIGASGDLSARKLLPALYNLGAEGLLPRHGSIVGAAPVDMDEAAFIDFVRDSIRHFSRTRPTGRALSAFLKRLRFVRLDPEAKLTDLRAALQRGRRLVYLAVPPAAFTPLIAAMGSAQLSEGTPLIIEKPFGHDVESARTLNDTIHSVLPEERVFRIDHYLGKETVQNLMVFRVRAVMAMEPPVSFDAEAIRNEKVKVLRALKPLKRDEVVRGQYSAGVIDGTRVPGYRHEPGVDRHSQTETYAALRLCIDSWRWSGVPFFVRTGKRMAARDTRIVLTFRDVPFQLFADAGGHDVDSNRMVVRIQPDDGIAVTFVAKVPGPEVRIQPVEMDFTYSSSFKTSPPEAYERLLHDALDGDHTLFIREDEVERGWTVVDPVLTSPPPIVTYRAGSWGPKGADALVAPIGWHKPEGRGR